MSKIARVFHLNKEIQKIYKNGVLQKLFFDWKKYIGEEINIEYARGYCSNRININGKVYQNLASKLYIGAGNTLMPTGTKALEPNGYTHIKLPYALKPNTSYTIVIDVVQPSEEHAFQLRNAKMEYLTLTIPTLTNKLVKGMNAATFTTSSNEISAILIKNAQNSTKDLIIKNNVIVIEGDLSGETIIEDSIKYLEEGTFVPENRIIEGKTYQNLLTNKIDYTFSGSAFYYNKTTLNNGAIYTRNNEEITSEVYGTYITLKCHKVASMLKSNTTYTLAFNIESTFSDYKGITVSGENDCYFKSSTSESNGTRYFHNESFDLSTGYKKIMFETNSNITQYFGFGFPLMQSQSEGTYLKITNIILLEGDYTHIDLPNSINGIESVGKREFVKSKNLYNKNFMNSTMVSKGEVIDSRGFTFTLVDNCTFKINGTNTTGCTIISENILDLLEDGKSYILSTNLLHFLAIITYKDDTPPKYTSVFTVNKSVMNTISLYNQWADTEIVTYNNFVVKNQIEEGTTATEYEPFYEYYPVTIRNYNYKCGTDNTILPNGVKNSIDTIDGKKVHTRRVGAVLLNGTQDMTLTNVNQTLTTRVRIRMDNAKVSKNNLLCNWFIRTEAHGDYEYIIIQDSSEGICLFISVLNTKLSAPTADGVKQYFSENPLWVFYELATPTYTYLESGLYDDITIPTPSNIRNEIYLENGKWYHKRNIGKVIFDGSSDEKWSHYKEGSWARFDIKMPNDAKMYSTRKPVYAVGYQFDASKNEDKIIFISGVVDSVNKLYIYNYAYTTVADFRAYLAENPLEVYYELAEPVISELYFNDITYKINEPLRSLPNGTCDTIEGNKLVQRVGKVILDGVINKVNNHVFTNDIYLCVTYGDTTFLSSSDVLNLIVTGAIPVASRNIMQEKSEKDASFEGINKRSANNHGIFIRVPISFASTTDEFNTYLQQNPMTVYYPLAEPIETELNLPTIFVKEGTNLITTTNNIKPNIQAECLVRCNETNMLNVKEFVGDANVIIDKIKVEKGTTYLFTFTNNLGENDVNNTPNIIVTDKNISIISNTHNTLYGATIDVNLGVAYTYKSGYQFTSNYDYVYITSCNANTTSKNLSDMCLKRV